MLREQSPSVPPSAPHTQHRIGFALVLLGAVLWGSNGITGALTAANSEMSWAGIIAMRMLFAGLALLAVTMFTGELRRLPHTRQVWRTIVLTAGCSVVFAGSYFYSLDYIGVAIATVVSIGAVTISVTTLSAVRHRRLPAPAIMVAVLISMAGILIVCFPGDEGWGDGSAADFAIGIALSAASGVAFGLQTLINSSPIAGLTSKVLVGASFALAGLVCMPWAAVEGFNIDTMTPTSWTSLAVLTFGSTVIGYFAYYQGLHLGVQPTTAAISVAVEPVVAGVLAVWILDEHLTLLTIGGMALILAGVTLVRPRVRKRRPFIPAAG